MDLKEALSSAQEYAIRFKGLTLYFTLRNPTNKEDLEFRRRSGQIKAKSGKVESSDAALDAPIWLLDQIKTKVEYSNGTPERFEVAADLYEQIPNRTKLLVISRHLAELEGEEAEIRKN
jgi:hypothetical protein